MEGRHDKQTGRKPPDNRQRIQQPEAIAGDPQRVVDRRTNARIAEIDAVR
jgi:hypothetical protein